MMWAEYLIFIVSTGELPELWLFKSHENLKNFKNLNEIYASTIFKVIWLLEENRNDNITPMNAMQEEPSLERCEN
jgi:hypothetical protein